MDSNNSGRNRNLAPEVKQGIGLKTDSVSENGLKDHENIHKGNISSRDKAVSTIKW